MSDAAGTGLAGRIALVSGGGRGAGRGISEELAAAGAAVESFEDCRRLCDGRGAPYNVAKWALESLAYTLAKEELRYGTHVNVVAPGLVVSEMGRRLVKAVGVDDIHSLDAHSPFGHVWDPADVGRFVRFLVSEGAGYVTGQRVEVDGGGSRR